MIRALALVLVVLFLVYQSGIALPTRVSIIRPMQIVNEHAYLRYQVQVDPQAENRSLVVGAFDEGVAVRLTKEQLDGAEAPRTRWIVWRNGLPAGEYLLVAALIGLGGREVARASVPLVVLSRFGQLERGPDFSSDNVSDERSGNAVLYSYGSHRSSAAMVLVNYRER